MTKKNEVLRNGKLGLVIGLVGLTFVVFQNGTVVKSEKDGSCEKPSRSCLSGTVPCGDGTAANPYQIANQAHLVFAQNLPLNSANNFCQTKDILLSDKTEFRFIPSLNGFYRGQGRSIRGFKLDCSVLDCTLPSAGNQMVTGLFQTIRPDSEVDGLTLWGPRVRVPVSNAQTAYRIGVLSGIAGAEKTKIKISNVTIKDALIDLVPITSGPNVVQWGTSYIQYGISISFGNLAAVSAGNLTITGNQVSSTLSGDFAGMILGCGASGVSYPLLLGGLLGEVKGNDTPGIATGASVFNQNAVKTTFKLGDVSMFRNFIGIGGLAASDGIGVTKFVDQLDVKQSVIVARPHFGNGQGFVIGGIEGWAWDNEESSYKNVKIVSKISLPVGTVAPYLGGLFGLQGWSAGHYDHIDVLMAYRGPAYSNISVGSANGLNYSATNSTYWASGSCRSLSPPVYSSTFGMAPLAASASLCSSL